MPLSGPALPIANYAMVGGTKGRDLITGLGAQVVLGGAGDDILGAQTSPGADGVTPLIPWLVGGADQDKYFITPGSMAVVADLGGGKDELVLDSLAFRKAQIRNIDRRHALISRGNTRVLVVDPAGRSNPDNTIETLVFKDQRVSGKQLFKLAKQADTYWGRSTLAEQVSLGSFPLNAAGVDVALFNGYLTSAAYNDSLVV
ncbi:hypothetical protein CB0101_09060 [Synechococcus sp. CB0101]|uniref:hypothetical protein n=1 Tax=Synechococcus sp. CB0101 TaxID=232348 RepID=UPI00020017D0|nr:hypothetical protein [Synechococcus sp. CB0101]QCH15058.1 hypothetical protein CB0101_09060 [Synechococcus sp. CB0101]